MPKVAAAVAALVVAVVLVVVLTRPGGDGDGGGTAGGELSLLPVSATGPDPFTPSTARDEDEPRAPATDASPTRQGTPTALRQFRGSTAGLYGGTKNVASCDVPRQIDYLAGDPAKNRAFASALGIEPSAVPDHLRSLTPVRLRYDTWVTNHGYRDGAATRYQAVLQAGTAVLVDRQGVPRVRCACGNPLDEPVLHKKPRPVGKPWPGYRTANAVVVAPAERDVDTFVLRDVRTGDWIARKPGGKPRDTETAPPDASPSPTVSTLPPTPTAPPSTSHLPPSAPPDDTTTTPADETTAPPDDTTTTPPDDTTTTEEPAGETTPEEQPPAPGSPPAPDTEGSAPPPES
ncbi:DUF6777 domain-containing protein [Streptomyces sp. NPDC050856]|uniref:DUF6777 domain-containing protein n=1 Tax=Streptomyces sp. NPDC050856 TaxID=3154939 RepID=UPI0033FAF575